MSNFAYIRPSGVWNAGVPVLHTELTALDQTLFKAPNFAEGGAYAPSDVIYVDGAGLQIKLVGTSSVAEGAQVNVYGGLSIGSDGTFEAVGVSNFWGLTRFNGPVEFNNWFGVTFTSPQTITFDEGTTLTVRGSFTAAAIVDINILRVAEGGEFTTGADAVANLGGTLKVSKESLLVGTVTHAGITNLEGNTFATAIYVSNMHVSGAGEIQAKQVCSGAGRTVKRYTFIASTGANSSAYGPANTDRVVVNALTADVVFTINNTDVQDGDEIVFVNKSPTYSLGVADPSNGIIQTLKQLKGLYQSATFYYQASSWELLTRDGKID